MNTAANAESQMHSLTEQMCIAAHSYSVMPAKPQTTQTSDKEVKGEK